MSPIPGRLGSLTARDVMSSDVLVLRDSQPITEAVQLLKSRRHSGAPVTDSRGRLVGTFSLRNLTGVKPSSGTTPATTASEMDSSVLSEAAFEKLVKSSMKDERVCERMTENAPSVSESASLIDVARLMYDFHTHRIPVTNVGGELTGIITTMDVMAALVHTADEMSSRHE